MLIHKIGYWAVGCLLMGLASLSQGTEAPCYTNLQEVLGCFLKQEDKGYQLEAIASEKNPLTHLTVKTYRLSSQYWPIKPHPSIPTTRWQHTLTVYIPKQISHTKALLYVTGGYNRNDQGHAQWFSPKERLDYEKIAIENQAIVIELQDVPNQYVWMEGKLRKEDQILAYTYKKVMEAPFENAYLSGHLPMAKAIIKAMDAGQTLLKEACNLEISGFIVAGASKRGWAVWLAALADERIEAIIPIVIDILNTQKSIAYICRFYEKGCPPALKDYEQEGIIDALKTEAFSDLMSIEDPFQYLKQEIYRKRLAIPKYIINASGDDFFVPDSSQWYFKALPGQHNYIRYLPNAAHYFKGNPISDATGNFTSINEAVQSYFYFILNKVDLPKVSSDFEPGGFSFTTSHPPVKLKLWVCENEETRDFRFIHSYTYVHLAFKKIKKILDRPLCDHCYVEQTLAYTCAENSRCSISVPAPRKGWKASFVELHYEIQGRPFIITTEVKVTP